MTKSFTAAHVLQEVKKGTLSLDDPVSKYVKDWPDKWGTVTVRRALTHTGGLPEYLGIGFDLRKDYDPRAALKLVEAEPLDYPAGMMWSYSNAGYLAAGLILESVTKKKWPDLVQERIFGPVGMKSGVIQDTSKIIPNRAHGYVFDGKQTANAEQLRPGGAYSAGAIICSSSDLAKWGDAVMHDKVFDHAVAWERAKLLKDRDYGYGMGWFLRDVGDKHVVDHGGNTFGFSANLACYPTDDLVIAALSNEAGLNLSAVTDTIARQFITLKPSTPKKVTTDPDKARTYRLMDALVSALSAKPDPSLVSEELRWQFKPLRMVSAKNSLKAALLPLKAMLYIDEKKIGTDTEIIYEVVGKSRRVRLRLLVDSEGKLVRFLS